MTAFSNRKKVRGWRKQIKKINHWFDRLKNPSIWTEDDWQDKYIKIWIDPWYRLRKRNPPVWYFNLILDKLDLMYNNWDKVFRNSNFNYDLQIWIFEKHYIRTELVSVRVDDKGEQRNNFFFECPEKRKFPAEKFKGQIFNYKNYDWILQYDTHMLFENFDELTEENIAELISQGYNSKIVYEGKEDEQRMLWKPQDYVWIGRRK